MSSAHQLFIGRLPLGCRSKDLEDIFYRYGKMNRCDVKQGNSLYVSRALMFFSNFAIVSPKE